MRLTMIESIAGAVAREIERLERGTQPISSQGAGYKAAWDRMGSPALKHCDALTADRIVFSLLSRSHTRDAAMRFAIFEAGRYES